MGKIALGTLIAMLVLAGEAHATDLARVTASSGPAGTQCTFVLTTGGTESSGGHRVAPGVRGDDGRCVTPVGTCVDDYSSAGMVYSSDRGCTVSIGLVGLTCFDRMVDSITTTQTASACGLRVGDAEVGCERAGEGFSFGTRFGSESREACGVTVGGAPLAGCERRQTTYTYSLGESRTCSAAGVSWTCHESVDFYLGRSSGHCVLSRPGAADETYCTDPVWLEGYFLPTTLRRC